MADHDGRLFGHTTARFAVTTFQHESSDLSRKQQDVEIKSLTDTQAEEQRKHWTTALKRCSLTTFPKHSAS